MNCLRFTTRTGLVVLVAVLIVGGMMPAIAGAAEKPADEVTFFDPFALDTMMSESAVSPANAPIILPAERTTFTLRSPKLVVPKRPSLFSPFRPGPF